jgi:homoserine O-acetyltransferase/O-succinyltransferase
VHLRTWIVAGLIALGLATVAEAQPKPEEGVFVLKDFRFASGETLPELKIRYLTVGSPKNPAVLVLHGTGGRADDMLSPGFGGALFGPGQPLDSSTHFIVIPDAIGAGGSSKPSDGLRARFPHYDYADIVTAQHRLLTERLGVKHLKLVTGNSMGGMLTWLWGEAHPGFMDALVPLAASPTAVAGRNWMFRRMVIDMIEADPAWNGGNYTAQPAALGPAIAYFGLLSSGGTQARYAAAPTWKAADEAVTAAVKRPTGADANDLIYALRAARTYDPEPGLERIEARVLAINSEDDERNPAELGVLPKATARLKRGAHYIIPATPQTRGHGTTANAALWADRLAAFLAGR